METHDQTIPTQAEQASTPTRYRRSQQVTRIALCVTMIIAVGIVGGTDIAGAHGQPIASAAVVDAIPVTEANHGTPVTRRDGRAGAGPDRVADHVGGIAARLRRADGTAVPGAIYLLMATVGSDERARLFDTTPFTHDQGAHADTIESNHLAATAAEAITGTDVELIEFTTAPGGGPSGGLTYLIAYLNIVSGGAFTGDLRVAASGALAPEGYIAPIRTANEKAGAAQLSGADVFFTSSDPSHAALAEHAGRHVGRFHTRYGRATLAVERRLDEYSAWGATAPNTMDVVSVGHIADVAAYFCGAGSDYACSIAARLGTTITSDTLTEHDLVRMADGARTADHQLFSPTPGSVH
jgi:hypothetical protein